MSKLIRCALPFVSISLLILLSAATTRAAGLIDGRWSPPPKSVSYTVLQDDDGNPIQGPVDMGGRPFGILQDGTDRRLVFNSSLATRDMIEQPLVLGTDPFAFSWQVTVTKGKLAPWRNSGVAMVLATSGIDRMTEDDLALLMVVQQQGVRCTVVRGGCYDRYEDRPGVWRFRGREMPARYDLSMGGGGGHDYSVRWPDKDIAGTTLKFSVWRDAESTIRFAVFHEYAPDQPWWEGEYQLPEEYAEIPFTTLGLRITNESALADPPPQSIGFIGEISSIESRRLRADERYRPEPLRIPTPAHWVLNAPTSAVHPSVFYTKETLPALRAKFNDRAFADYKKIILQQASEEKVDQVFSGGPSGWSSGLTALTWAYVLTEDPSYWLRIERAIDRMTSATDHLKQKQSGWPGRKRQHLSIDEFNGHNVEALATTYDCLYDKLDSQRRTRILRVLNRGIDYYLERIRVNDWWYRNNPSNTIGVGNGLNGVVALVMRAYRPDDAKKAVDSAVETIKTRYIGVADDGGCLEGNMYWNYGMSYPIWLGYALRHVEGDDRGLLTSPKMIGAENYLKLLLAGDGRMLCFNDTQPWLSGWLVCAHAGSANDIPLLRKAADHMAARFAESPAYGEQVRGQFCVSAFLGRDRTPEPNAWPTLPTLHVVDSIQEGILRSDGALVPRMVTGVKGKGALSTHHANEDQGSVVVYARGELFLIDPGYFNGGATDHTVPILGEYAPRTNWDPRAEAPIVDRFEAGELRGMTVDASRAHRAIAGASSKDLPKGVVRRVIVQAADRAVVWLDDIDVPRGADRVTAQYQCGFPVEIDANAKTCRIEGENSDLLLVVEGPTVRLTDIGPREFHPNNWVYGKLGVQWHTVRNVYTADPARPLITVCLPVEKNRTPPKAEIKRSGDRIEVKIDGTTPIVFKRDEGRWMVDRD